MSRSTKIGLILAAIGQSVVYTFGVMALLRMTLLVFGTRLPKPISGSLFLATVAVISSISVYLCVQQMNRAKSLPDDSTSATE